MPELARVAISIALLLVSVIVHEVAHGWVAHLCGDDTAKNAGRLTLNPLKHIDPVGSVLLPVLFYMAGGFFFAFAKPVPYNPLRLKNRRRDEVLVALAGPASNLVQAVLGMAVYTGIVALVNANPQLVAGAGVFGISWPELLAYVAMAYVFVNLSLAFFNLIPLPPLDGSKVLCLFLDGQVLQRYYQVQRYAMPILIVLLYLLPRLGIDPISAYLDFTVDGSYALLARAASAILGY